MRTVLFALAVLTFTRIAYAEDINITIQGDPWKASPLEARKQYLRGREADEMIRKGYSCFRLPSGACDWEKLADFGFVVKARWGKCVKSTAPVKGRMCERLSPHSSGFYYYDFERPFVLLEEKIYEAQMAHPLYPNDPDPVIDEIRAAMLKKAQRLTAEQVTVLEDNFGDSLDRAFRKVDPAGWKAAQAAKAAQTKPTPAPALTPDEMAAKAKADEAKQAAINEMTGRAW